MSALVWLTWRQHRWTIIGTTTLALLAAIALVATESRAGRLQSMPITGFYGLIVQLVFGVVIGMFWGAPLIARELEERTYFVAWGQDVTPDKWLRGKSFVLCGLAVVLGAIIGSGNGFVGRQETWGTFESSPLVQAGYVLFGFALGLFIGLLSRHVVTAMAATLVFYTFVRFLVAMLVRDHYLPVDRAVSRWGSTPTIPPYALETSRGFVGADLRPMDVTEVCAGALNPNNCMRDSNAAIGTYIDYQPIDRLGLFQFIEFLVFALLAAVLFALTFRLLRKGGGWKPSRSHRRLTSEPVQSTPAVTEAHAEG